MSQLIGNTSIADIGLAYSIVGLAMIVPICFAFNHYWRMLDFMQMFFLFSTTFLNRIISFYFDQTWLSFMPNFLTCNNNTFSCQIAGNLLSFGICIVGAIIIAAIIIGSMKTCFPNAKIQLAYRLFKGLFRWIFLPLVYFSIFTIARFALFDLENGVRQIIVASVVLAIIIAFTIIQLIIYTCLQQQTKFIRQKWIEFSHYWRLILVALLIVLFQILASRIPLYFIYVVEATYVAVYMIVQKYDFPIIERVIFILGQAAFVVIYSFFLFRSEFIFQHHLDFYVITGVGLFDLFVYIAKSVKKIRQKNETQEPMTHDNGVDGISAKNLKRRDPATYLSNQELYNPYK